jgi:HK97 family phage prohead protease
MRDLYKASPLTRVKALTDADQPGTFEALVSLFGNVDLDGDIVMPGAFTKTLSGGPKPLVFSHQWQEVPIGQTLEAYETPDGLYVKGRLFVGADEDHARAREVYAAMRGGALTEFSWGGKVTSETFVAGEDGAPDRYELNEIDLVEYGPCLKGSNPSTRLLAVKSMVQAGIVTRDEARLALELAVAKSDEPAGDAPAADAPPAELPDADAGTTDAEEVTNDEARDRIGLPPLAAALAEAVEPESDAHASALAELDLAA